MWREHIGRASAPVRNTVERGAVRKFAAAIGDASPLYADDAAAARSRHGRLIAPPTFPRVFDYGHLEGATLPEVGVIHGEQSFRYERPLFVGEDVLCHTVLADVYERQGRRGRLTFVVLERVGDDATGTRVFATREVYVLTDDVRRSVES